MEKLDPRTTALVLVDLQKGVLGRALAPRSGADVLATGIVLAERFRAAKALVVLVRVDWAADFGDALRQPVDRPNALPPGGLPADWSELASDLVKAGDIIVTKRQWGAFYGTDLDVQLRRRGIKTVVLGGIATNIGVESTARQAWEHGYNVVVVEDAMTSLTPEMHAFSVTEILPRISIATRAADVTLA